MSNPFFSFKTYEQEGHRIELTAVLTNYLLAEGIGDNPDYAEESAVLKNLATKDERVNRALKIFNKIRSHSARRIFNRYEAVKKELSEFNPEFVLIGAAGLSPLGHIYAKQNPEAIVYDTDLQEIAGYRKNLLPPLQNYHLEELDLLKEGNIRRFVQEKGIRGRASFVVEGLTFYLDKEQNRFFHRNLQDAVTEKIERAQMIFEYYTSNIRAKQRDAGFVPKTDDEKDYITIFGSIGDNQNYMPQTDREVLEFLKSCKYPAPRLSKHTLNENPQKIWVCEYK